MRLNGLSVTVASLIAVTLATASPGGMSPASQAPPSFGAVFASDDGGATFARTLIPGVSINALAVDPSNPAIVYAATSAGVYQSSNGGLEWNRILSGVPQGSPTPTAPFNSVAIDPSAPCRVLASVEAFSYTPIAASGDCGVSWADFESVPDYSVVVRAIVVAPTSPRTVYFAGATTTYPGALSTVGRCSGTDCFYYYPSADVRALATDPANNCTAYAANVLGNVIRNTDCANWNWSAVGGALDGAINTLAVPPTNQLTVFAGTEAGTIYKFTSGIGGWVVKASLGAPVRGIVYNPADPSVLSAWFPLSMLTGTLSSLATSPADPSVLYAGALSSQAWVLVITSQPQSHVVSPGTPATLSVAATGTAPLTYQWYQGASPNTGSPIGGATLASYTTPPLNAPASYWVRVSNSAGSADSATATLSIGIPKTIALSGNLVFGNALVNTTPTRTLTISNTGAAPLTVTGITYPAGFTGAWAGVVAAGSAQDVTVTFSPMAFTPYGGTVTAAADHTGGTNTIVASGSGVTPPDAPAGVSAANSYSGTALVTFKAPGSSGGSPITGYVVTSNPAGGVDTYAGSLATGHYVGGLTTGTSYTFMVVASNAFGSSVASAPSNSVTIGAASSSSLAHFSPANGSTGHSTSPLLSWNSPMKKSPLGPS